MPPPLNPEVQKAEYPRIRKIAVGGVTYSIPRTKDGRYLLWRCLPHCGNCCFPRVLALLPRDVEALAQHFQETVPEFLVKRTQTTRLTKLNNYPTVVLQHPKDGERCPHLNKSEKCSIYVNRPHPCRLYPFNYDAEGNVGFKENAVRQECPGFYLADAPDSRFLRILGDLAPEVREAFTEIGIEPVKPKETPMPLAP